MERHRPTGGHYSEIDFWLNINVSEYVKQSKCVGVTREEVSSNS